MTPELGKLITTEQHRDAIHIAVAPVVAGERLSPGTHVGLLPSGEAGQRATPHIGIADPFLTSTVDIGERFWLFLYPQTVTNLRHDWTHPAFTHKPAVITESERWLRDFAKQYQFSDYDDSDEESFCALLETLEQIANGEDVRLISFGSSLYDLHTDQTNELWRHFEIHTGKVVTHREINVGCSC